MEPVSFSIVFCFNGVDSFRHWHVVICARHLGAGDGAGFLVDCRRLWPQIIRIMLIERQDMVDLAETVNQAGLYAFMIRPLRPAEVLAMVENAFEWRRMARTLHFDE